MITVISLESIFGAILNSRCPIVKGHLDQHRGRAAVTLVVIVE